MPPAAPRFPRRLALLLQFAPLVSFSLLGAATSPSPPPPAAGTGWVFLRNFPPSDYHGLDQVWCSAQDARGLVFFGTRGKILEFDGETWRHLPGPKGFVRALAHDAATDTLAVGGDGDFGLLARQPYGRRVFTSLLPHVPADERARVDQVLYAAATPDGIFFLGRNHLFRWRDGALKLWPVNSTKIPRLHLAGGTLYVQERGTGLLRFDPASDALKLFSSDAFFTDEGVYFLAAHPAGGLVLGTPARGLYLLRDNRVTRWTTDADSTLEASELLNGAALSGGRFALGLQRGGALVLDAAGRLVFRIDETTGLGSQTVSHVSEDRDGGLWLATEHGPSHVETRAAFSLWERGGQLPRAVVRDIRRHEGALHLATAQGVFRQDPANGQCTPVPGLPLSCFSLVNHPDGLLVTAREKVLLLRDGRVRDVWSGRLEVNCLALSAREPGLVWIGSQAGLGRLRFLNGAWRHDPPVAAVRVPVRFIAEAPNGDLWLGTPGRGVARVQFDTTGKISDRERVRVFGEADGLRGTNDWISVALVGGEPVFLTAQGLDRFDATRGRFEPDPRFGAKFSDGSHAVLRLLAESATDVWLSARPVTTPTIPLIGRVHLSNHNTAPEWSPLPAYAAERVGRCEVLRQDEGMLWAGGSQGLVRIDLSQWPPPPRAPFRVQLRAASAGAEPLPIDTATPPSVPYARNTLRLDFAAAEYAPGERTAYQTRLEGHDDAWSTWAPVAFKEYTNLREGFYRFHVRARHGDTEGAEATFAFVVAPPAARTPLAYALYAVASALAVFGIVRWRVAATERERRRLENLVTARTAALAASEAELRLARDAAEEASQAKGTFLAQLSHELRTPLNVILGYVHMLMHDKPADPDSRRLLRAVGESGDHLLRLIDEVLDLSKIEAGKMEVHPEPCDVAQLLDSVNAAFSPRAAEKGLAWITDLDPRLPTIVITDAQRLRQILFNLLGNALKFTARGSVTLRVTVVPSALSDSQLSTLSSQLSTTLNFSVTDTGIGIATTDVERIFRPYEQTALAQSPTLGTGLGLPLSQRMVALLGGKLSVESAPGRGSRFWFELTLPVPADAPITTASPHEVPAPAIAAELLALANEGGVVALRERLATLRLAEPRLTRFTDELDTLATAFAMQRIRDRLRPLQ